MSGLTHFIAALAAIAGLVLLIIKSGHPVRPWYLVSFIIFGAGMILLYSASALYHWLPLSDQRILLLKKIDHIMIFILIAATYTPICLIPLRGPWGWSLFGSIWGMTIMGIFMKLFWINAPRRLATLIYVVMGWLAMVAIWPLFKSVQIEAFWGILTGGLFYTIGAVIYATKKPDPVPGFFGFHEIFHVFVMLGSFSHFWVMYKYL